LNKEFIDVIISQKVLTSYLGIKKQALYKPEKMACNRTGHKDIVVRNRTFGELLKRVFICGDYS